MRAGVHDPNVRDIRVVYVLEKEGNSTKRHKMPIDSPQQLLLFTVGKKSAGFHLISFVSGDGICGKVIIANFLPSSDIVKVHTANSWRFSRC